MKQEKIYLKDYTSPAYQVEDFHLDFILNEDFCRVLSKADYVQTRAEPLVLDGESFKLVSLKMNGRELAADQYKVSEENLEIFSPPAKFTLEIETELQPQHNKSLEGLYKSNGIFCTQCEAQGFRKISYFLDRPDVMTKYSVTIEADKKQYPVLLSNGDRIKIEDIGEGRHKAYWQDPHKKPCYLFALVAGDLGLIRDSFTTRSGRHVNLEVYAAHGKQGRCWHAMKSLQKSMKWDEDVFGLEYDLNDYMIVAIDDFNAGAMENKGLNIFNSRLVLADTQSATDDDFNAIESVVAHEYFHNWTGNRVTLRDWFQLSLKEGLTVFRDQEFSADMLDRGVQRIENVDHLRISQFAEDSGPNAHPVRPESCMAVDNFFTMTIYEKGAELIRMMQNIVGRKGFRKGMDEYFRRYDGQAVTTEDFADAIATPNKADFTQLKRWYNQAGTPVVEARETFDAQKGELRLQLKQSCPPTPGQTEKLPFHIPILMGLLDSQGRELQPQCSKLSLNSDGKHLIELKEQQEEFVFTGLKEKPVLSLLREFSAPIHLRWYTEDDSYYFLMAKDTDSFNRREAAQKMGLKQLSQLIGKVRSRETLSVDPRYLKAMSSTLQDTSLDPAFKALMLHLPTYSVLCQEESVVDAPAFHQAKKFLKKQLAVQNESLLQQLYLANKDQDSSKHRSLKNTILSYLVETGQKSAWDLVISQYRNAANMTDKLFALQLLVECPLPERQQALDQFYNEWKDDSVVLNKWFVVQAISQNEDALSEVKKLSQHPSFNISNPNNVYSLLRAFGGNIVRFNTPESYEFFADKIIEVDKINPQVAARLCSAFNFVKKYDEPMKQAALQQIRRICNEPHLSKNSRELLQPSLENHN